MAENSSSGGTSIASAPARSDDPAWAHGQVVAGVKNASICIYCNKWINGGGVTRLKYHLAGIKEPGLLDGEDISWESIEAPFVTLNLDDEETCVNEENELGGNDQLLECLVHDFPYVPPQDQDPYFYINDVEDV
uniref:BED-type domain-containing protein n=1 Tax=Salix viminalis TaxID=40686 RepID=A0A6N2KSH8_SALVM